MDQPLTPNNIDINDLLKRLEEKQKDFDKKTGKLLAELKEIEVKEGRAIRKLEQQTNDAIDAAEKEIEKAAIELVTK